MERTIPREYLDLFEKKAFAHLATLNEDGSPHLTPIWVDYDGEYIIINTARGRRKLRNMQRNPKVAIEVLDPDDPYRYLSVNGRAEVITEEGADQVIDHLSEKYTGVTPYPGRTPGMVRVTVKIRPESIIG